MKNFKQKQLKKILEMNNKIIIILKNEIQSALLFHLFFFF